MKRHALIISISIVLILTFVSQGSCRPVVFFIGGWGMTPSQMESFSRSVPESEKVKFLLPTAVKDLTRPWHCADLIYDHIQKNGLAEEDLYFVAFSLGGIVTQWLLSDHPELPVKKLILVGSPMGGYKFLPPNPFFSNNFPEKLPIYVIAGSKGQKAWFLRDVNDGVVDLKSALDIRDHNLKEAAVFHADHNELEEIPEVQAQISRWLGLRQEPPRNVVAGNTAFSRPTRELGGAAGPLVAIPN